MANYFLIGDKLGEGQFGTTYHCKCMAHGAEYACKFIPNRNIAAVSGEVKIMRYLSDSGHPGVVRFHGAFEDAEDVYIFMELCTGGDLYERADRGAEGSCYYDERTAAKLIRAVMEILEGCHSRGVMHRDVKPENFLFASADMEAPLKVIDFGFSVFFKPGDVFYDRVGTTYYMAPEVIKGRYGPEADIWSAGVILYILLCGVAPFWDDETEIGIFWQILNGKLDFESKPWQGISDHAKDLVRNMLNRDPKKRFNAHNVLCHPWIVDDVEG